MLENLRNGTQEQKNQYAEILTGYIKLCGTFDTENSNIETYLEYSKSDLDNEISFLNKTSYQYTPNYHCKKPEETTIVFISYDSNFSIEEKLGLFIDIESYLKQEGVDVNKQIDIKNFQAVLTHLPNIITNALCDSDSKTEYTLYVNIAQSKEHNGTVLTLDLSTDTDRKEKYVKINQQRKSHYDLLIELKDRDEPNQRKKYSDFMAGFIKQHGLMTAKSYQGMLDDNTIELQYDHISNEANYLNDIIKNLIRVRIEGKPSTFSSAILTTSKIRDGLSLEQISDAISFALTENTKEKQDQSELWHYFTVDVDKNLTLSKINRRSKEEIKSELKKLKEEAKNKLLQIEETQLDKKEKQFEDEVYESESKSGSSSSSSSWNEDSGFGSAEEEELARVDAALAAISESQFDSTSGSGSHSGSHTSDSSSSSSE
jgi:hypothetical protein